AEPGDDLAVAEHRFAELHVVLVHGGEVRVVDDEDVTRLDVVVPVEEDLDLHRAGVDRREQIGADDRHLSRGGVEAEVVVGRVHDGRTRAVFDRGGDLGVDGPELVPDDLVDDRVDGGGHGDLLPGQRFSMTMLPRPSTPAVWSGPTTTVVSGSSTIARPSMARPS